LSPPKGNRVSLNNPQRRVLIVVLFIVGGLALFPPWVRTIGWVGSQQTFVHREAAGYAPLWSPPEPAVAQVETYVIDWGRLLLSWVAVAACGTVAILVLGRGRDP
jgi:hypothetical protein